MKQRENGMFRSLVFAIAAAVLLPAMACANVGPPWRGGQVVAEPTGTIDVDIKRETLHIDLRPLAANELAVVEAVYHLDNRGAEKKLELLFASGSSSVSEFHVWLDKDPVPTAAAPEQKLPESWQPPRSTPPLPGGTSDVQYLPHRVPPIAPLALTVVIPPGRHDLRVQYKAEAATHLYGQPTVYRQFAYVLAPARSWASFGGLDVQIDLPADWRVACEPDLKRVGDALTGSFGQIPADSIALTVQAPEGPNYDRVSTATTVLFGVAGLGGPVVCWYGGLRRGRRNGRARILALGLGCLWALAVFGAGLLAVFAPEWTLPEGQATHYGYGQAFAILGVILLSVAAAPVGFLITLITASIVARDPGRRDP